MMYSRKNIKLLHTLLYVVLFALAFTMLVPFLWMVCTSIKPDSEVLSLPPRWFPKNPTFQAYKTVWQVVPFGRFFFNSMFVAIVITAFQLLLDAMAAYGFVRKKFPCKELIFIIILSTMMVPKQVTMIPLFIMMKGMPSSSLNGWLDTYKGLIVPGLTGAYGVFMLRQFMKSIPIELEEAAQIDGYPTMSIFFTIVLPLCKTALISLGIFVFLWSWNDFIWPLIVTSNVRMRTLPVGIAFFQGQYIIKWNLIMAASAIATLPIAIVYFLFQREFVNGIALSGIKE